MVFSSILFLFYFLPLAGVLYFVSPKKYRNAILLVFSIFFYSWGEPKYIFLMIFSILLDYTCGRMIHYFKTTDQLLLAKRWLLISIIGNLGLLGFFKYTDFLLSNINNVFQQNIPLLNLALPIGISFYTFQTMSYSFDIYRGEAQVQKNLVTFGAYVTLFPQLIAGPIVRYQTIAGELENRTETYPLFWDGTKRFIIGLGKKVLLANNIGLLWDRVLQMETTSLPVLTGWLGIVAFGFQIYFDFSGYSDMANGLGKMFGFHFLENFDYPYMARSITEFWRKWHISLGTWFKEYVYIPLGGNRVGIGKQVRNILLVWLLTGIWHGASWNFALWGLYFGILLLLEKAFLLKWLNQVPNFLRHSYTLFLVLVSWVWFAFDDIQAGAGFLKSLFDFGGTLSDSTSFYLLYTNAVLLVICTFAATDFPKKTWGMMKGKFHMRKGLLEWADAFFLLLVFLLSTAYLVDQTYNPFLYFRF